MDDKFIYTPNYDELKITHSILMEKFGHCKFVYTNTDFNKENSLSFQAKKIVKKLIIIEF